jgi:hypothetical protein
MRYILAPSSLAGRGLGVGFLYLITPGSAVSIELLEDLLSSRTKLNSFVGREDREKGTGNRKCPVLRNFSSEFRASVKRKMFLKDA